MLELKEGDKCKVIVVSEKDAYYKNRKKIIGKIFLFEKHRGHRGNGFVSCNVKSKKFIKILGERKKKHLSFYMVKLKKI